MNVEIYSSVIEAGESIANPNTMAWFACQRFGFRPPSDFFSKITNDDVIQIYTIDAVHRFANMRFFEICSYTLEQLYSMPWHLLWNRNEEEMAALKFQVETVFSEEQKGTLDILGADHDVYETTSPFKYETKYHMKHMAPLYHRDSNKKAGMIVAESVHLEGPSLSNEEEEKRLRDFYSEQADIYNSSSSHLELV